MKKIVKIVAFRGNSGNSGRDGGGDGVLNSNHLGTGWKNWPGFLGFPMAFLEIGNQNVKATKSYLRKCG